MTEPQSEQSSPSQLNVGAEQQTKFQKAVYEVIFGYESKAGRWFDLVLIILILSSVAAVFADSVASIHQEYGATLYRLEWVYTLLFTAEYLLRIYSTPRKKDYIFSFYGIIDLFSILPTFVTFIFPSAAYLLVIRIMRVLRIFRILKLFRYMGEANILYTALMQARYKILVFLFSVVVLIVVFGALIFLIEGPEHGFTSIPKSVYWAIVTITTVGYGDIAPQTATGQFIAAIAMICGYAVIAVPTGIIGAELMQQVQLTAHQSRLPDKCSNCGAGGHDHDAKYCKHCGTPISQS